MTEAERKVVTKSELSEMLGISNRTRAKYMNSLFYEDLKKLGYQKASNILNAKVVNYMRNEFLIDIPNRSDEELFEMINSKRIIS